MWELLQVFILNQVFWWLKMIKLILCKPEKLEQSFILLVRSLKNSGIIVLASKPHHLVGNKIERACGVHSCLFLDTISESDSEKVIYLPAENLTALSIAINQAQQSFSGKVTVVFDSITNLSIKNDVSVLMKFFSFLLTRVREWGVDLVLVLPREGIDEGLLSIIKQSADKIEKR